jgi:hypothetical protein
LLRTSGGRDHPHVERDDDVSDARQTTIRVRAKAGKYGDADPGDKRALNTVK